MGFLFVGRIDKQKRFSIADDNWEPEVRHQKPEISEEISRKDAKDAKPRPMDVLIWINALVVIFAVVVMLILLYMSLHEVRMSNEALSRSSEALSRVERLTLATLERVSTQQGSTT